MDDEAVRDGSLGWHGWFAIIIGFPLAAGMLLGIGALGRLAGFHPQTTPPPAPMAATSTPWTPPPIAYTPLPPFTVCVDGWVSHSTGSGTCSHHGGER